MKPDYLEKLRAGEDLGLREQISLVLRLSVPAILAQTSTIVVEYISKMNFYLEALDRQKKL